MPTLASLPPELTTYILHDVVGLAHDGIDVALHTLNALSRTNRLFHDRTNPLLYWLDVAASHSTFDLPAAVRRLHPGLVDRLPIEEGSWNVPQETDSFPRALCWAVERDLPGTANHSLDIDPRPTIPAFRSGNRRLAVLSDKGASNPAAVWAYPRAEWAANRHVQDVAHRAGLQEAQLDEVYDALEVRSVLLANDAFQPHAPVLSIGGSPSWQPVPSTPKERVNILHMAVACGSIALVGGLLDRGLPIDEDCTRLTCAPSWEPPYDVDPDPIASMTPLELAIWKGELEIVKLLLARGAGTAEGRLAEEGPTHTAAHLAIRLGYLDLAAYMIDNTLVPPSIWSSFDEYCQSPVHLARHGAALHVLLPRLLTLGIDLDAVANFPSPDGRPADTVLELCCYTSRYHDALVLVGHGAKTRPNPSTGACLLAACFRPGLHPARFQKQAGLLASFLLAARMRLVETILASGYDVNYVDPTTRRTALLAASRDGDAQGIRLLVQAGASIGDDVLEAACRNVHGWQLSSTLELLCGRRSAAGGAFGMPVLEEAMRTLFFRAENPGVGLHEDLAGPIEYLLQAGVSPNLVLRLSRSLVNEAITSPDPLLYNVLRRYGGLHPTDVDEIRAIAERLFMSTRAAYEDRAAALHRLLHIAPSTATDEPVTKDVGGDDELTTKPPCVDATYNANGPGPYTCTSRVPAELHDELYAQLRLAA